MVDSSYILEAELLDGLGKLMEKGQSEMNPCLWASAVGWCHLLKRKRLDLGREKSRTPK